MAKKNFSAGSTKSGVLNNDGGEKIRLFLILRMNSIHKTE